MTELERTAVPVEWDQIKVTLARSSIGIAKTDYSANFTDVTGLQPGDLVKVAGVDVGQVQDVAMTDGNQIRVDFDVRDDQPVTGSTKVLVRYENLIGHRFLELADRAGDAAAYSDWPELSSRSPI